MPKIVRFHKMGGADVLQVEDLAVKEPGEGEVRLKVEAIGSAGSYSQASRHIATLRNAMRTA